MELKYKLSMPYWCVGNPVSDPFGLPVLDSLSSLEVTDILCQAKKDGLIDFTSAHDDDLVPWNPKEGEDDQNQQSQVFKTLHEIKKKLDEAGVGFKMISCNLHANSVFRNGGLTNPDPRIRLLAAKKVMRAMRIGHFLGAEYFTYWVARDGFETPFAVPWDRVYSYLIEGLNLARAYAGEKNLSIKHGTIEYKPNEPRGEMFLPTVGHSLALISRLEDPDFWGVNPEVLQHDQMTGLTSVGAVAFAANMGKLFFLHVGNQKPDQFDNDNPVLIGLDGLKEFISILFILGKQGWNGYIEFDNHMLRTDAAPGEKNKIDLRKKYIALTVQSYREAEKKANSLLGNKNLHDLQKELWDKSPELALKLKKRDFDDILNTEIDYKRVNESPVEVGKVDLTFNKEILGM